MSKVLMKTDKGQLTIDLFDNDAPKTVKNFLKLVKEDVGLTLLVVDYLIF